MFHLPGYEPPAGSTAAKQHEQSALERVVARAKANGDAPALNGHGKPAFTVELDHEPAQGLTPGQRRYADDVLAAARRPIEESPSPRPIRDLVDDVRDAQQVLSTRDLRMEYFDLLMRIVESAQGDEREDVLDRLEKLIAA